ncbi:MAG: zinc-binding dehydrogenase, partial [Rhodocyclaceae bacterium]|nr:zinc-binding dehydrogenase [Rhodocyclaceae bacterium]
ETALELGASRVFHADDPDCVAQVRSALPGGVEVAIEAASSVKALELAYRITRRGGTTVTCSLPNPGHTFNLQAVNLVAEERTLKGSYLGSAVPARDIPRFIELYKAGRLPVDKLITHRLGLGQINEGFDRLAEGMAVRQVILF